jgi:NADH-quinone oxidoreductase subunit M
MAAFAALGLVLSTIYAVWMVQKVFFGANDEGWRIPDLEPKEMAVMAAMIAIILWLGLYPQPCLDKARDGLSGLQKITSGTPKVSSIKTSGRQQ